MVEDLQDDKTGKPTSKTLNNFSYTKSLILTINCAQIKAGYLK